MRLRAQRARVPLYNELITKRKNTLTALKGDVIVEVCKRHREEEKVNTYKVVAVDTEGLDYHWFITAESATDAILEAMIESKAQYNEIVRIRAKQN